MTQLKQGDLVYDYEGHLTLIVLETEAGKLIPITLGASHNEDCCTYYNTIQGDMETFIKENNRVGNPLTVVGNLCNIAAGFPFTFTVKPK